MVEQVKTGDQVELRFATSGHKSNVLVNGEQLAGAYAMTLETRVDDYTRLTIETVWPRKRGLASFNTFTGYFVEEEDWRAYCQWQEEQCAAMNKNIDCGTVTE